MEKLKPDAVKKALQAWLGKDAEVELSRDDPNGRITGWIMHPRFTRVPHTKRQSWLWDGSDDGGVRPAWAGLRNTFKGRSAEIGLILTYSPAEYQNAFGESA